MSIYDSLCILENMVALMWKYGVDKGGRDSVYQVIFNATHAFQYKNQLINLSTGTVVVKYQAYEIVFSLYKNDTLMRSFYAYNGISMKIITGHTLRTIELKWLMKSSFPW